MRAVRILLSGCAVVAAGCAAWPQPARTPTRPELAAPEPRPDDPFRRTAPPVVAVPRTGDWPRVHLGHSVSTPPASASPRSPSAVPTSTVASVGAGNLPWRGGYESTQRRAIHTAQLGSGGDPVLITSSLAGNDPLSVQVMDALLARFAERPELLAGRQALLVRSPNPDGLAERIAVNARGVDLNRNFPSPRFTASPTRETGPHPASEAETRVLLRLLGEVKPHRVVHLRSGTGERLLVTGNGSSLELLAQLRSEFPVDVTTFDGEFKAGSLEEFAATRLKAQVLVIELPARAPAGDELIDCLVVAVTAGGRPTERLTPSGSAPVATQPGTNPAALTGAVEPAGPDGEKGYVELLPPPPHFGTEETGLTETRFYELPPP